MCEIIVQKSSYKPSSKNLKGIIQNLCAIYEVHILPYKFKNNTGTAYLNIRSISIPLRIDSIHSFLVAIHGINHILINDKKLFSDYMFNFQLEYDTEMETIKYAKSQKFITKEQVKRYEYFAKRYITRVLFKDLQLYYDNHNILYECSKNILKYLDLTQDEINKIIIMNNKGSNNE